MDRDFLNKYMILVSVGVALATSFIGSYFIFEKTIKPETTSELIKQLEYDIDTLRMADNKKLILFEKQINDLTISLRKIEENNKRLKYTLYELNDNTQLSDFTNGKGQEMKEILYNIQLLQDENRELKMLLKNLMTKNINLEKQIKELENQKSITNP